MTELLFPCEKESFVPATQHGCCAQPLYFDVDAWNVVTVCGVSAGCTTDGNNVPGIHVVFRLYYVHFLFCRVKNMLL